MSLNDDPGFSADALALLEARHGNPFGFLGPQQQPGGGVTVRVFLPKAHAVRGLGNTVHANAAGDFVKIDVAGVFERQMQVNRPMPPA